MYKLDLFTSTQCAPPDCKHLITRNVSTADHVALSRRIAMESIVLLKNDDQLLPLKKSVHSIAIIGSAATAEAYDPNLPGGEFAQGDYYSGGGSGHCVAAYVVTPFEGLVRRAEQAGIEVFLLANDNVDDARALAAKVDVAIVVGATTSGESIDRPTLDLDNNANELISAVAEVSKATIVLMQVPGAILTPWRDSVQAAAVLFLGGMETGNAWASVVFGDHSPTGRLPVMLPESEADTISPVEAANATIRYEEGLATSYRNPNFKAAYPFGHGLSYATFKYHSATVNKCGREVCVRLSIENTGKHEGREVVQLYLEFPAEAGQPAPVLKGFETTSLLKPRAQAEVTFRLGKKELSYYSTGSWLKANTAVAHVGSSSKKISQRIQLGPRELGDDLLVV